MAGGVRAAIAAMSLLCFVGIPAAAGAQNRPPVEAFGRLPFMRNLRLSPDGKHLALLQAVQGRMALVIYTIGAPAGAKPALVAVPDWDAENVLWVKNDRVVLYLAQSITLNAAYAGAGRLERMGRAISLSAAGDDMQILFKDTTFAGNNAGVRGVSDLDLDDNDHVNIPLAVPVDLYSPGELATQLKNYKYERDPFQNPFRLDMYSVDVRTGEASVVENGTLETTQWFMDGHGHPIVRVDETQNPLVDHVIVHDKGGWREAGSFDATADKGASIAGLTEDGTAIVRFNRRDGTTTSLDRMDIANGADSILFAAPRYDVDEALIDEWSRRVVGVRYTDDRGEDHYFDPQDEALQRGLEQAFPGVEVHVASLDLARDRVIVETESPQQPPSYYYLDRTTHQATLIASSYPELHAGDLGTMKPYPYAARDGMTIPAYLTLPPGRGAKNLPLVVMPHGGPDARDKLGFDWWAQFLANRGYAVLQPNYRGSSGYGNAFTLAGKHQWGLKMQDDVTDGVKKAIADGIADPKRVCIVGASYGGYAALAGATFTSDLYACAVSFAGVSDLPIMLHGVHETHAERLISFWESRIGSGVEDSEQLRATSPARHADQVKCPVLLLHGADDTTVPVKQSEIEEDALVAAHKNVRFVRIEGDDHYMELASTRIRVLREVEAFLAASIGN